MKLTTLEEYYGDEIATEVRNRIQAKGFNATIKGIEKSTDLLLKAYDLETCEEGTGMKEHIYSVVRRNDDMLEAVNGLSNREYR